MCLALIHRQWHAMIVEKSGGVEMGGKETLFSFSRYGHIFRHTQTHTHPPLCAGFVIVVVFPLGFVSVICVNSRDCFALSLSPSLTFLFALAKSVPPFGRVVCQSWLALCETGFSMRGEWVGE